jgi:hypothetical protein
MARAISAPLDVRVEDEVALDVPAWHVEKVELTERRGVPGFSAASDPRREAG